MPVLELVVGVLVAVLDGLRHGTEKENEEMKMEMEPWKRRGCGEEETEDGRN